MEGKDKMAAGKCEVPKKSKKITPQANSLGDIIIGVIAGILVFGGYGLFIGVFLTIVLIISYIIPGINILAILLVSLKDRLGLGMLQGILAFIGLFVLIGCVVSLIGSSRMYSNKEFKKKLEKAGFRFAGEDESSCRWCEYEDVDILDKSDPDNSKREFYCKQHSFKFDGATEINDLEAYTCNYCKDLMKGLADLIIKQNAKKGP